MNPAPYLYALAVAILAYKGMRRWLIGERPDRYWTKDWL